MRKVSGWVLATGIVVGLVVGGCGTPTTKSLQPKLETQVQTLGQKNYKSVATMTVQMDHTSQTYYVETWYDSDKVYRISLGDQENKPNQIIVKNNNGMFIVSPALQKVFRFNGDWAQNQGHIYLYDQILQQIVSGKNVKVNKSGSTYTFHMPVTPANDVVTQEKVVINAKDMTPQTVVLYDKSNKAVVTINYQKFQTDVKFHDADFNPHKLVGDAKQTLAPIVDTTSHIDYVEPDIQGLGDKLRDEQAVSTNDVLLRYSGDHAFTLSEYRPAPGVAGLPEAQMVDVYGIPAIYSGGDGVHQMTWLNNGLAYSLTSTKMSMDQMMQVAVSMFGGVGK